MRSLLSEVRDEAAPRTSLNRERIPRLTCRPLAR